MTTDQSREALAQWMIKNSFATGHGDTLEGLLEELAWQVEELRGKREAVLEEAAQLVEKAFENNWVVQDALDAIRALKKAPAAPRQIVVDPSSRDYTTRVVAHMEGDKVIVDEQIAPAETGGKP